MIGSISSYVDLLVFDLSDVHNIQFGERKMDVFRSRYKYVDHGVTPQDGLFVALASEGYTP